MEMETETTPPPALVADPRFAREIFFLFLLNKLETK